MHPLLAHLLTNDIKSLEALGIYANFSKKNPRKFSLNYDQIDAENGHPLVNLCRGVVLRSLEGTTLGEPGEYEIIGRPFDRFYNLGSSHAAQIDWDSAAFEEKLDGTLCIVYFDSDLVGDEHEGWCVATRNVPDGDVPNHQGDTFADLFWRHADIPSVRPPMYLTGSEDLLYQDRTYMFELMGPENQIVVVYDEWKVTLLASRNNETGEITRGNAPVHRFANMEEAREWLNAQPGHKNEGFVIVDKNENRLKIKSANYLTFSRVMTSSGSDVGLVEIVLSGTADDVMQYLPLPRQEKLTRYEKGVAELAHRIETFSQHLKQRCLDRKSCALAVQAHPSMSAWMPALMPMWVGTFSTFGEFLTHSKKNSEIPRSLSEKILNWIERPRNDDPNEVSS